MNVHHYTLVLVLLCLYMLLVHKTPINKPKTELLLDSVSEKRAGRTWYQKTDICRVAQGKSVWVCKGGFRDIGCDIELAESMRQYGGMTRCSCQISNAQASYAEGREFEMGWPNE